METIAQPNLVHMAINHYSLSFYPYQKGGGTNRLKRFFTLAPSRCEVAKEDLEREINQHSQCEILFPQSLLEQLEGRSGVIRRRSKFRHEMHQQKGLHIYVLLVSIA